MRPFHNEIAKMGKMIDEWIQIAADAQTWARECGNILLDKFRSTDLSIERKQGNASDVVTEADKASESHLISRISEKYPEHAILAEESGSINGTSTYRWVIDPLDGTTNYSNGLPLFSVSIGVECRGGAVVGVVYAPYLDEMFTAVSSGGAYLNGRRIHVNNTKAIEEAVVATGFPVDKHINPDNNMAEVSRILPMIRGLRRLGSAAIDLSYVAAGYLDGYWEFDIKEWDACAGRLIVQEAGGLVTSLRDDRNVSVLASSPGLHNTLLNIIKP